MNIELSYRKILTVALPLFINSLSHNLINLADTAFLGRLGQAQLGAGGNGSLLYLIALIVMMGFSNGIQILIGNENGRDNPSKIGGILSTGLGVGLISAISICLLFYSVKDVFLGYIIESPEVLLHTNEFFSYRIFGLPFSALNMIFMAFFTGITQNSIITWMAFFTAALNVVLDYLLIFGNFGFPEWGVAGAAIASAMSEASTTILWIGYFALKRENLKKYHFTFTIYKEEFFKIVKISSPLMVQTFIALSAWFFFSV